MEDLTRYKHKSLVITGIGTFMGTLDSSIVNVSLPTISRDLGTTIGTVGWVILSYAISLFSLLVVFGVVSEKKGFQFSYKYGFAIFLFGSALCGVSFDIHMLIISRVIQGVGAALLVAVGPALITRSFPESERGKGLSVIAMVVSTGLMLGPPLGGFLIALGGWRWIFFVNVPVCMAGIYLTNKYISDFPVTNPDRKISFLGAGSLSIGLLMLMISLLFYSRGLAGLTETIILTIISILLLMTFFYFENNPDTRLIGIGIFRNRVFAFSGLAMLMIFISLTSVTVLMPFYLEEIKSLKPEEVGLYLMIIPLCGFFMAPLSGYLSDKIQARIISTAGAALLMAGMLLVRQLGLDSRSTDVGLSLFIIGTGMGIFGTPNTSSIMGSVNKCQLGSASGILATIRTLGISLGVGLSIAIFSFFRASYAKANGDGAEAFIHGYKSVYSILILATLAAIFFSLVRGRNLNSVRSGRN